MTSDPDRIRQDIERTRSALSTDVDALAYKASPSRMVNERKQRFREAVHNVRDRVMGSAEHAGELGSDAASTVSEKASAAVSAVGDAASEAPRMLRRQTQGNPLAAGLIMFGLGWLASSLVPPSRVEQQAAQQVKETVKEHSDAIGGEVKQVVSEIRDDLREPATEAVESVKLTAADAAATVKDESRSAVTQVQGRAQQARDEIRS